MPTFRTDLHSGHKVPLVEADDIRNGALKAENFSDGAVTTEKLADGAVTTPKINNGAITEGKLANGSITTVKIQNNAVTEYKIGEGAVTEGKIASNAVTEDKIGNGAVTKDKIADDAITNNKIANDTITGGKFIDGSISGSKIKDNSVPGSKLADGAIGAVQIQDNTLNGSKLIDGTVDGVKLKDRTVTLAKLKDNSIPGSKLLDESISGEKIQPGTIHGNKLEKGTVDGADIINGTLDGSKIANMSVDGDKLAKDSIETRHIKSNTISGTKIANDAIDYTKIRNYSLVEDNFANGAVTEDKIGSSAVTNIKIANDAVTTGKIADSAVTTDKILNGAVTTEKLAPQAIQQITDLETQFQGNETTRQNNETTRISNETGRVSAEDDRVEAENSRVSAETSRDSAETTRQSNETTRQSNETTRQNNETTRISNETGRVSAEDDRVEAENSRVSAETSRDSAETTRQSNETTRQSNETTRQNNETTRQSNETQRQTNETNRTATASADHNTAVEDHNQAATDHTTAVSDHSIAEEDHTQAVTDHNTAETDHTTATTDHSTAADDHDIASEDHNTATSDHTRAESDHTNIINAIASADLVFDISLAHASEGVLAQYADLAAALGTDGVNVPSENRHGGMTVKFVQSSDSMYMQFRCTADEFTTDVTQWQGVDDEPTAGSDNLVKSGGVKEALNNLSEDIGFLTEIDIDNIPLKDWMLGETNWYAGNNGKHIVIPVREGYTYFIKGTSASRGYIGWLTSEYVEPTSASAIPYVPGTQRVQPSSTGEYYTVPEGAAYLCINRREYSLVYTYDIGCKKVESVIKSIEDVASDVETITSDVEAITEESIVNYIAQGTIYNGVVSPNKECLYSKLFYKVKPSQTINITRASDILVRINEYKANGEYYRGGNNTYAAIDSVTLGNQTAYIQISASYTNRSESVTINDYIEGDFGIKLDNPIYSKQVFDGIRIIEENINELQQAQAIDILKLSYVQGSLYQNTFVEYNSKCISCLDYIGIEDLNNTLVVVNQKQQDGKYWKVRVIFYDASKTYIRQDGYTFIDGSWNITIPQNAKFARFSISLIDSDGTDISCTPADIPTDGTRILLNKSVAFLLKDVTELHQDVTELKQDVSELKSFYAPIPLNRLLGYSFTHLFNVTSGYGDAACYNGLIFQFVSGNEYVYVHDAADGTLVQTITMPNPNSNYHNNSVTFGNAKYDEGDTYPLLYASQETAENKCIVYRVTGTTGNITLEVVQTIAYPANYVTKLYYHNCYIDTKNNYLILGGLVNSPWSATDGNTLQYMAFNLPALASGDVTLDMANVLFKSPRFTNMPTTQGGFCKDGYLYQVFGVNAPQLFMVYDIKHCKFCYIFNFTEELMNAEPEGAFEYDNKVCVVFNGGAVYKLNP